MLNMLKKIPASVPSTRPAKVNGFYSDLRPILHSSFIEILLAVFVLFCSQTNQPTNSPPWRRQQNMGDIILWQILTM